MTIKPAPDIDLGPDINCRGLDGDLFFTAANEGQHDTYRRLRMVAEKHCRSCLVRPACASIGSHPRFRYGLWGGVLYRGTHAPVDLLAVAK